MSLPLSTLLGLFVSFGSTNLKQNSNQIRTLTYHVITLLIFSSSILFKNREESNSNCENYKRRTSFWIEAIFSFSR